ncbi:hypothetical protein Tco_1452794 [Tanacetum coccineum]
MSATSSNHANILAIHEVSRECVWLRSMTQHIRESCGISSGQESPLVVHEDNAACIAQLKDEYIKGCQDRDPTQDRFRLCKIEIVSNYGVTCEDKAKRRNSGTKTKTFEENCYLLPYAVSSKEDTAYQRQLITRIRVMINS